jgi:hypothetical protein
MSDSTSQHQDGMVEEALALLHDAVRKEPFVTKDSRTPAHSETVATNVVVASEYPDGHRSVLAASSVAIVTGHEPDRHQGTPPSPVKEQSEANIASEPTQHPQPDLVEEALSMMRAVSEVPETASSSPVIEPVAKLANLKSWLDMERADRRRRVEAFKATQVRFQKEREDYCAAALNAAKAGERRSRSHPSEEM